MWGFFLRQLGTKYSSDENSLFTKSLSFPDIGILRICFCWRGQKTSSEDVKYYPDSLFFRQTVRPSVSQDSIYNKQVDSALFSSSRWSAPSFVLPENRRLLFFRLWRRAKKGQEKKDDTQSSRSTIAIFFSNYQLKLISYPIFIFGKVDRGIGRSAWRPLIYYRPPLQRLAK